LEAESFGDPLQVTQDWGPLPRLPAGDTIAGHAQPFGELQLREPGGFAGGFNFFGDIHGGIVDKLAGVIQAKIASIRTALIETGSIPRDLRASFSCFSRCGNGLPV